MSDPGSSVRDMGTVIDLEQRRRTREAGAEPTFARLDEAVRELAACVAADDREPGDIERGLADIKAAVDERRLTEAAAQAEELVRRLKAV